MGKLMNCSTELWEFRKLSVIKVTISNYNNPDGDTDESVNLSREVYYYSEINTAWAEVHKLLIDWETHVYNGNPVEFVNAYNSDSKKVWRHDLMEEPIINEDYFINKSMLGVRPVCKQTNEITMEVVDVEEALQLNNEIKKR